jgi:hypothetical protein
VGVCVLDTSIGVDREHDEYKRRLSMLIVWMIDSDRDRMHQIDKTKEMSKPRGNLPIAADLSKITDSLVCYTHTGRIGNDKATKRFRDNDRSWTFYHWRRGRNERRGSIKSPPKTILSSKGTCKCLCRSSLGLVSNT